MLRRYEVAAIAKGKREQFPKRRNTEAGRFASETGVEVHVDGAKDAGGGLERVEVALGFVGRKRLVAQESIREPAEYLLPPQEPMQWVITEPCIRC